MTGIQGLGWRGQGGRCQGSWSVGVDDFLDPADVFADPGVDSRVLGRAAGVSTPGKDALQGLVTHKGATRVTLGGGGRDQSVSFVTLGSERQEDRSRVGKTVGKEAWCRGALGWHGGDFEVCMLRGSMRVWGGTRECGSW